MEQGNYKSLILKLSGAAFGLVVMLAGAATLGQNFLADKSTAVAGPEKGLSPEELELTLSMNEEFRIVVESGEWLADRALKEVRLALETMKSEHFDRLLEINSDTIDDLREVIEDIAKQMSIPSALKEDILADLERQLAKTEKKLSAIEDHIVTFSYKMIPPQSKYLTGGTCSQEDSIVEKCVDGECAGAGAESRAKGYRKGSIEAFYWI